MDDRYSDERYFGPQDQYQVASPCSGGDHYSSAREYAAAGDLGRSRSLGGERSYGRGLGQRDQGGYGDGFGGWDRNRDYRAERGRWDNPRGDRQGYDRSGRDYGRSDRDRGFFDRAGDEVRSWFGDEEAERRREADMRYDDRMGRNERWSHGPDDHYRSWRRSRIEELDRDYDEYRRENAQRFENEFNNWRTDRQGQRDCLRRVSEHMDVVGSDGTHVGTVDKVRGDRVILTKSDPEAGGHHHSIPSRWIDSVSDKVMLRKTAEEAQAAWKDEERSGALFGSGEREGRDWRGEHNLNRSFSGTY